MPYAKHYDKNWTETFLALRKPILNKQSHNHDKYSNRLVYIGRKELICLDKGEAAKRKWPLTDNGRVGISPASVEEWEREEEDISGE